MFVHPSDVENARVRERGKVCPDEHAAGRGSPGGEAVKMLVADHLEPDAPIIVDGCDGLGVCDKAVEAPRLKQCPDDRLRHRRRLKVDCGRVGVHGVEDLLGARSKPEAETAGEDLREGVKAEDLAALGSEELRLEGEVGGDELAGEEI